LPANIRDRLEGASRAAHWVRYESRIRCGGNRHLFALTSPLWDDQAHDGTTKRVERDSDILIEGFPRSGNSFTYVAFARSQPEAVKVAHHLHAPAHVAEAVRLGVPALVVIRRPIDAISSLAVARPQQPLGQFLREYAYFYSRVERLLDETVVATFDEVTGDFDAVMRRVNRFFGTNFATYPHGPDDIDECFALLEEISARRSTSGSVKESGVARPSTARAAAKKEYRDILLSDRYRVLGRDASAAYERLLGNRIG
jgi:hypothetical protein